MSDFGRGLPRERLDALNGWKSLRPPRAADGFVPAEDRLQLARARDGDAGLTIETSIPATEPFGSLGGRALPRGLAVRGTGDIYLVDPDRSRVLYTRATLPPPAAPDSTVAPFVPLWSFEDDPGPRHPLRLTRPVDVCLIPDDAPPGAFADALVVADAGRDLLVWVDRRRIVTRHVVHLSGTPAACAAGPDGRVAVLVARDGAVELLIVNRGVAGDPVALDRGVHSVVALRDHRLIVIGRSGLTEILPSGRTLPSAPEPGALVMTPALEVIDEVLHLPGCADAMQPQPFPLIAIDRRGRLKGSALPLVARSKRLPRPRTGEWLSQRFDGEARGFAWDRVALDALVPSQCRLLISTFVAETAHAPEELETTARWSPPTVIDPGMPLEFLVQRNRGRYLWLKIEAFGDGQATPSIRGIDLHGPRDSQLKLLPAPFHQEPVSADFLDRFLSLQDAFLGEALSTFERMSAILCPESTPESFIDWLGGWFDWRFLADWDLTTRREMIAQSMSWFAERGTARGMTRLLRWHTGLKPPLPVILEDFRLAAEGARPWLIGEQTPIEQDGAHRFTVVLPASIVPDAQARDTLVRLIEAQKPAHTQFRLAIAEPALAPGRQARLGVDAILPDSRPPPLGDGRLDDGLRGGLRTAAEC